MRGVAAPPRAQAARFLRDRWRVLVRLGAWSVLEAGQTFLVGYALARALDAGFLAGSVRTGLGWLGAAGLAVCAGAYGTGRVYGVVAELVEPARDRLVTAVVGRGVREADPGALSGLTQQVELARDTLAGVVMVSRSFLFTAAGALIGLFSLAPLLLTVVLPPLLAGVALFAVTLRPLARRQEAFLIADETLARELGALCPGLRDVTACGAEERVAADLGRRIDAELATARALARWSLTRTAALAVGGELPVVLLLVTTPWLLRHGVSAGALVGALAYVTQSLLPALQNLVHGLGTSGSRLTVVLRRLTRPTPHRFPHTHTQPTDGHDQNTRSLLPTPQNPAHGSGTSGSRPAVLLRRSTGPTPHLLPHMQPTDGHDRKTQPPPPAPQPPIHDPDTNGPRLPAAPRRPTGPAPRTLARTQAQPADGRDQPQPSRVRPTAAAPATIPVPALDLASVSFAYGPASEPVLDGLDLSLPASAHLAVVGPSGIGKSTLTGLIAGLLTPDQGTIRVHGNPVPAPQAAVLIPQEAYVHGGTLAENLTLFRPGPVPEAELLAAADAVGLNPLLRALGGPGARVEPAALSAGERQLIALTRAYLSAAPLALLDEATCHLDPAAEARAERAFAGRPGGTLLVVAHRLGSARRAGRILVMDGARTACGTHDDLLRTSALYRQLTAGRPPSPTALPR
ncbi:ATP-binding cassette domain-containing protein [Streptomyces monashensis]|uniref:ATP-binding cassette domain-containing protein n=1 Tax=Streptomyces monashensis TaxID=1678012 RepID=UPI0033F0CA18